MSRVGIVAIGRNEGERLELCLASLPRGDLPVVYVDSGSSDGSVERALAHATEVVELDYSAAYTAARGRNAGFEHLLRIDPTLELIQFVDGDCQLQPQWIESAAAYLEANPKVGIACGRRRERDPQASPYNRLMDLEWDTPIGETDACGGDAMIRTRSLCEIGGYDATLIAGEDPEMSYRMRQAGYRVVRLDCDMTLHDAAMQRFSQWWKRQVRAGHACAELAYRHGLKTDGHRVRHIVSIVVWSLAVPGLALMFIPYTRAASLIILALYACLWLRIERAQCRSGRQPEHARLYASGCVISKFAELWGVLIFSWSQIAGNGLHRIIEYKGPGS